MGETKKVELEFILPALYLVHANKNLSLLYYIRWWGSVDVEGSLSTLLYSPCRNESDCLKKMDHGSLVTKISDHD